MRSWLIDQTPLTEKAFQAIISCVKKIVKQMGFKFNKLLMPTIMYADKYLTNARTQIHYDLLFQLLLTSAIVAVKMWEDTGADMELVSYLTNTPKKDLGTMERLFLQKLNYELVLTTEDIEEFENDNQEPAAGGIILLHPIATTTVAC